MNSDNVRNPCPIGPPNGDSAAARSGSTWIHWWSSVASANVFTRSWVTSSHSVTPSTCPLSEGRSASVVVVLLISFSHPVPALRLRQTVPGRCVPAYPLVTPACGQGRCCRAGNTRNGRGCQAGTQGNTLPLGAPGTVYQ